MTTSAQQDNRIAQLGSAYERMLGFLLETAQDGIVAHAGGGKALATPITGQTARVTTCATPGDSVLLPPAFAGMEILLINHGAQPMSVYGQGTDTIDDVVTANPVSHMQSSTVIYTCPITGLWYTEGLASGYDLGVGLPTYSSLDNITATAGGTQGSSLLLATVQSRIVTIATTLDSVKLPIAVPGINMLVANAHASNSLGIWPGVGDNINATGVNAQYVLAPGKSVELWCASTINWHVILST